MKGALRSAAEAPNVRCSLGGTRLQGLGSAWTVVSVFVAVLAAVSAFLTMRAHQRNLFESIRPELMLDGWSVSLNGEHPVSLEFATIRNVGRGVAFRPRVHSADPKRSSFEYVVKSETYPVIGPGESMGVDAHVTFYWGNVAPRENLMTLEFQVALTYWDRDGRRYRTTYEFVATDPASGVLKSGIGPGVMFLARETATRSKVLVRLDEWAKRAKGLLQNGLARLRGGSRI